MDRSFERRESDRMPERGEDHEESEKGEKGQGRKKHDLNQ